MPRGDKDGSIKKAESGFIVRKRYTDLHGVSREKKRVATTRSEAAQIRRELADEIAAELAGVDGSQRRAFEQLVSSCYRRDSNSRPADLLAATLLNLESGLEATKELLPELDGIDMKDFCNPAKFQPALFARSLMNQLRIGLLRVTAERQRVLDAVETMNHRSR
jgi:hypothetical protein